MTALSHWNCSRRLLQRDPDRPGERLLIFIALTMVWASLALAGFFNIPNCPLQPFLPWYIFGIGFSSMLHFTAKFWANQLKSDYLKLKQNLHNTNSFFYTFISTGTKQVLIFLEFFANGFATKSLIFLPLISLKINLGCA